MPQGGGVSDPIRDTPDSALLIFAGFRRLLSLGFELGFCRKAFSFVLRHGFRVIQCAG
jgi:hypothetical protein